MTRLRLAAVPLLAALSFSGCGGCKPVEKLPDVTLETLDGSTAPSLAECPAKRCMTIVITPWCGVCHIVVPYIVAFKKHLTGTEVACRVVVSHAPVERLKTFAQPFGPETLLDPDKKVPAEDGVPMFVITESDGRVSKRMNGFPSGPSTPEGLAATFGLP
ncbi:MAG: hypothetical protein HY078_10720 [Elusimicrobia bacterium]|nr:hypothetical protein [Elusimicrobiota bacterium]